MIYPELQSCYICPRNCGTNRYESTGFCGAGANLKINLSTLHHGEEPPLSSTRGSGTIFFSWCNLHCVFCQNYSISAKGWGNDYTPQQLAETMLQLQNQGAHNINLVTPTHYTPLVVTAIQDAKSQGLSIPIVWNSSAYERVETLKQLDGWVDIFLPDFKYAHGIYAKKYSHAVDYPEVALSAIKEMFRQVGCLTVDDKGVAKKGMIIRLLVLPNGLSGTKQTLHKLADTIGTEVSLSIMAQYYPAGEANKYPELNRGVSNNEYRTVLETAAELGFENVYAQELSCSDAWTPRFSPQPQTNPSNSFNPNLENHL